MAVPGVVGEWIGRLKALWASNPKAVIGAAVVILLVFRGFGGSDSEGGGSGGPGNPPSVAEITASMKKLLTTRSGSGVFDPSSIIVHEVRVSPRLLDFAANGRMRQGYACQIRWAWISHKKSTDPAFHFNKVSEYISTDAKASWDDFGVLTMYSLNTITPESERREPYTDPLE